MSYDGYKANWGRSTNIDRGVSKNHLQAADLNSVYTTVSSNSASWNSGGDGSGSSSAISTDTQDIYTTFSTDSNYPNVKLLLHGEGTDGDTEIVDDSPNHYTIQNTKSENNFLSSGEKKYGSSSIFLSGGTTTAGDSDFSSVGILFKFDDLTNGTNSGTVYDKSSNNNDATFASGSISNAQSKWGTTSLYGTLDTAPDASYDVGTGAFTAEAWVYYTSQAGSWCGTDESRNNALQIGHPNSSSFGIALALIIWDLTGSTVPSLNQWVHVAVCRSAGATLSVFIDGTRTATEGSNSNNYEAPDIFGIGTNGYIDSIRITKGVDRYGATNSSITVPTEPFPESASDSTTGGGLKIQDEDFSIDGDFTIETFVQPKDITNGGVIYSSGTGHVLALSGATGKLSYDGSYNAVATTVPVVTANTWSHIAVVREDGSLTVFANGVSALTTSEPTTGALLGTTEFTIGMDTNDQNIFKGFVDEFRITDGVARYSGSTYTVPAAAFSGESRFEKTVVTGLTGTLADGVKIDSTYATTNANSADWNYVAANSGGIAFDGSTANGVLTYKDSDEASVESNLTFDGSKLAITGNIHTSVHDYGTGADLNVDFDQDALQKYVLNAGLSADTAAANKGAGKSVVILLSAGSASRNFNWNSSWKFIGEKPASIAGNKVALLSMTCFGSNETDIICSYGVQD